MPKRPKDLIGETYSSFHDLAAKRGDGLHPLILQALSKSGNVAGPPRPSEQTDDMVVSVDFRLSRSSALENGKAAS